MAISLPGALLARELGVRAHALESCGEHMLLQHAVSYYCTLEGTARNFDVKSTIAAAFNPTNPQLVATSQ